MRWKGLDGGIPITEGIATRMGGDAKRLRPPRTRSACAARGLEPGPKGDALRGDGQRLIITLGSRVMGRISADFGRQQGETLTQPVAR
jgi:hypothetical protein